jgi:hypothetical protein
VKQKRFLIALLLVFVPLIDSVFLGNTFGLQWHSPALMYQVSVYLVPVKLLLTLAGVVLLVKANDAGVFKVIKFIALPIGVLHMCLLSLVCLGYVLFGTKTQFYRADGNIQLYTADVGAMGKSYHYFSYLCRNQYGFYTETPISKEHWLGQFSFSQQGNQLMITLQGNRDDSKNNTLSRDIPPHFCE